MSSLNTIDRINPEVYENKINFESNYAVKNPEEVGKSLALHFSGSIAVESFAVMDNISLATNYFKEHNHNFTEIKKAAEDLDSGSLDLPAYELRRMPVEVFIGVLVDSGVLSQELVDSGILDRFSPDRLVVSEGIEQFRGGFRHIFLGDIGGGLHDIDTLEDAGLASVGMDTARVSPTKRGNDRREKIGLKIIENPDLVKGTAMDTDGDGETDVVRIRRLDATSQFPENWTTDRVVTEIVSIVDSTEGTLTKDKKRIEHSSTIVENINGVDSAVNVVVFTDSATGLIESAYTQWGDRSKS